MMNQIARLLRVGLLVASLLGGMVLTAAETARQTIARAILTDDDAQKRAIVTTLMGQGDDAISLLLGAWRADSLFVFTAPDGTKVPVLLTGEKDDKEAQAAFRVIDGEPVKDSAGKPLRLAGGDLTAVEHDSNLRRVMRTVLDLLDVVSPDPAKRLQAVQTIGQAQDAAKLAGLAARVPLETDAQVHRALLEAIALIKLKDAKDEVKLGALAELKVLGTLSSADFLAKTLQEAEEQKNGPVAAAAKSAMHSVESHRSVVDFLGTLFRGLSLGSILLVLALGLAITFGLMGVINMAHGEMIAVGAYTTYLMQNIFGAGIVIPFFGLNLAIPGMHLTGWLYQCYFLAAIPLSFLSAALVGIGLERSIIQWLYRRPLESLLATWGVSVVLQQVFKLMFGSNNVQVSSPAYLSGNWTVNDVLLGWNRVFVIGFALVIVFGVWLVLTRTPLGLLIRAVMQNRGMASCMGVRTERVNMLTFGLGSGLAGLAGTFLSQIGNVGPSMGQNYIVDCFMTVVVGGVGNLPGTVISAFGIGMADQSLQQILLDPVIGKIVVLLCIILFLQWRPAGIFVTRSRSLD